MINHPIGEKWKERLVKEVTDSDGRLMPLTAISFIENLLEQERKRMSEAISLFGQPRCANLHHPKKYQHESFDHCPVEEKILSIINK